MRYCTLILLSGLLLLGCVGACDRSRPKDVAPEAGDLKPLAVCKTFGTDPVKFTIELSADSITTADTLTCRLTLEVGDEFEAEFPDLLFGEDVPGLFCTDLREREIKQPGGRRLVRTYELEPEYAGTFELPAFEVYYHRREEVKESLLTTEPLSITVQDTPITADDLELKPMRGLMTVERIEAQTRRIWPYVLAGIGGFIVLVVLLAYWVRRPRKLPPPPPPHEIALEALRRLVDRRLVEQGQIEAFFVEITEIVRDYIERAFGLKAPEQTTEEFLAHLGESPVVSRHRAALEPFLTAADEVKFARLTPEPALIQRTFDTARDFVMQTSNREGAPRP